MTLWSGHTITLFIRFSQTMNIRFTVRNLIQCSHGTLIYYELYRKDWSIVFERIQNWKYLCNLLFLCSWYQSCDYIYCFLRDKNTCFLPTNEYIRDRVHSLKPSLIVRQNQVQIHLIMVKLGVIRHIEIHKYRWLAWESRQCWAIDSYLELWHQSGNKKYGV